MINFHESVRPERVSNTQCIGVGRFRILGGGGGGGGGARFRILGGAKGGQISSRHMTS